MALRDEPATVRGEVDLERDRILVARSQAGDGLAFADLHLLPRPPAAFLLPPPARGEEAADVTQEAFTRASQRALPGFAGERRFYPWLTVIAGNLCTDLLRQRARSRPTEDLDRLRDPGPRAGRRREHRRLGHGRGRRGARRQGAGEAVDRASRVSILALREGAGLTYQEIATHEGVEITTVETLLWRAPQALKRESPALSGSGALGAVVLAAGTVRRLAGRLARRLAMLPVSRGGGLAGSLAVALTSAAVATVAPLAGGRGTPRRGRRGRRRPGRTPPRGGHRRSRGRHRLRRGRRPAGPVRHRSRRLGPRAYLGAPLHRRPLGPRCSVPATLSPQDAAAAGPAGSADPEPVDPRSTRRAHSSRLHAGDRPRWPRPRHGR